MQAGLGGRIPNTREVADLVGVSARSLQRELLSQGVTYRELLDRVRFDAARSLLCEDGRPVTEVALHLGYGDASNFTIAFTRWAGVSPSIYRRKRH